MENRKKEILEGIKKSNNLELLDKILSLAGGDDYDIGCFTEIGSWEYGELYKEFTKRLKECGFLTK